MNHPLFLVLSTVALAISSSLAEIQPADDAPQPMSPQESASRMRLPEGFRIELVAAEPLIEEPSCIAFDERGRLFVCELHGYNIEGHIDTQELNKTGILDEQVRRIRWELQGGKIAEEAVKQQYGVLKMLSDVDGDGVMDQAQIWADDLPPCYGVLPARGGVLVTCAPHIVFFADGDGDGRPEVRETLYTGFGIRVLERGINNPRWGLDHWIYIGSGGEGGTITGPHLAQPVSLGSTDFRIKADGSAIEPATGRVGTFGMTLNAVGDRFPSTGGSPAMYALPLPYHYLKRNPYVSTPRTNYTASPYNRGFRISRPHPWRVRRGQDPAWVKFYGQRETTSIYFSGGCSTTFYGDTLFPQPYQGNLFYCEPSLNIVHRCLLQRDGAGYRAQRAPGEQESEFLASADQWFRPMNLRVGPEGALYIVDMYREIIEDYSAIPRFLQQQYGLDRGKDHGRLWRLLPKGAKLSGPLPDFSKLTAAELAHAVGASHPWQRRTAQRLLIERNARSASGTLRRAHVRSPHAFPPAIMRSLYSLANLGTLTSADVAHALDHDHYGVRLHALRLAEPWLGTDEALLKRVLAVTGDPDPSVRLQLVMTLGEVDDARVTSALLTLSQNHGGDRWMDAAILSSCNTAHAIDLLLELLRQPKLSQGALGLLKPLATTIGSRRDPVLQSLLSTLVNQPESRQRACLQGLVDGFSHGRDEHSPSSEILKSLTPLLSSSSSLDLRILALKLAVRLQMVDNEPVRALFAAAAADAVDEAMPFETRQAALQILANAPFTQLAPVATSLLHARQTPALQQAAIQSLGSSDDDQVAATFLRRWEGLTPSTRAVVLTTILARENRLPALLEAMERGAVKPSAVTGVQREKLTASRDRKIATRAESLFENPNAEGELQERIDRYRKALPGPRDLRRGKEVFTQSCLVCHQLGSEGTGVGPLLGHLAGQADETILVDILDPSSKVDPQYTLYIVSNVQGESFAGVLSSESPTSIVLRLADGTSAVILRQDIVKMTASAISLMPANLHEVITPEDASNLIGFLRQAYPAPPN